MYFAPLVARPVMKAQITSPCTTTIAMNAPMRRVIRSIAPPRVIVAHRCLLKELAEIATSRRRTAPLAGIVKVLLTIAPRPLQGPSPPIP